MRRIIAESVACLVTLAMAGFVLVCLLSAANSLWELLTK